MRIALLTDLFLLLNFLAYFSALKMEALNASEAPVDCQCTS
jgi:hypothetical protein